MPQATAPPLAPSASIAPTRALGGSRDLTSAARPRQKGFGRPSWANPVAGSKWSAEGILAGGMGASNIFSMRVCLRECQGHGCDASWELRTRTRTQRYAHDESIKSCLIPPIISCLDFAVLHSILNFLISH